MSLLWRAVTFQDEREARAYDEHEDDLDVGTAVAIFGKDLTDRGISFTRPDDPIHDEAWSTLLGQTYLITAFAYTYERKGLVWFALPAASDSGAELNASHSRVQGA